jgi:hypothetical protein
VRGEISRVVVVKAGGRRPLEDLGIGVRIILKLIFQTDLAHDQGKWSALVKRLMNLQVP